VNSFSTRANHLHATDSAPYVLLPGRRDPIGDFRWHQEITRRESGRQSLSIKGEVM